MINTRISASSGVQVQELSGNVSNGNSVLSGLSATPASSSGKHSSHQPSMAEVNDAFHLLRIARQQGGFISADARARLELYQQRGAVSRDQINSVSQNRVRVLGGTKTTLEVLDDRINEARGLCDEVERDLNNGKMSCSQSDRHQIMELITNLRNAARAAENDARNLDRAGHHIDFLSRSIHGLGFRTALHHQDTGSCTIL